MATIIINNPVRIPGMYPAKNKAAMDTPPLAREYTISVLLGGMTNPVVDEVMFTAAPNSLE